MKSKLLAGLVAACFAAPVMAQSNITIYGIADAGLQFSNNGGNDQKVKLVSGVADGSRLGFKGVEDLGDGYKAMFTLEARVELDTGRQQTGNLSSNQGLYLTKGLSNSLAAVVPAAAGGQATVNRLVAGASAALNPAVNVNSANALFDRTAMVGLVTPYGAILMGRQYTPGYEVLVGADTFEAGTGGGWGGVLTGAGGFLTTGVAIRSDKSVQYRMELPNGIGGALMYGFEKSGYVGLDKKMWAANIRYKGNGFNIGLGHNHGTDQVGDSGLISTTLGGSYTTGDMKFFAGIHKQRNEHSVLIRALDAALAPSLTPFGPALGGVLAARIHANLVQNFNLDATGYTLGMHYKVGSGRIMASISRQDDKTASNSDATQYAIGYDYNISKRTDFYTVLAYIKNQNDGQYAPGAASASGGFTGAPGESGKALQIGMRHKF